jgi:hypothetical protein
MKAARSGAGRNQFFGKMAFNPVTRTQPVPGDNG